MSVLVNYLEKLEAQLKEWRTQIEILEEKAAKATGETKIELTKAIDELRQKKGVVKEKLNALQEESGIAWDTMKEGVENAVSDLKSALDKIIARHK
jgi:hypothetical protein